MFIVFVVIFYALLFDRLNIFLYLVISAVLHELGHISACIICHIRPQIKISVFGIKLCRYPQEKYKKLFVLLSGPLINLILAILSGLKLQEHFSLNLYVFLCINLVLFIFNILPVNFLDGGQIIQLFCQSASIQKTAEKASFAFIIIAVMLFTGNIIFSALAVMMFFVYCYINKKDLQ